MYGDLRCGSKLPMSSTQKAGFPLTDLTFCHITRHHILDDSNYNCDWNLISSAKVWGLKHGDNRNRVPATAGGGGEHANSHATVNVSFPK